mgnify:CR=1 FL=1
MTRIDLDCDLLRCFLAVAETRGFTAAGERIGLTQSGISVRIRRLEERLGRRLLERNTRQVALTEGGELFLSYARRMVDLNDEAVGRLRGGLADFDVVYSAHVSPYGAVPNPFDASYISGGSSSGSAYVVATGQVDFALGTDTAGSGRVPLVVHASASVKILFIRISVSMSFTIGYVELPNVDLVTEMTDLTSANRSYQANATVLNAIKQMALRALDIGNR